MAEDHKTPPQSTAEGIWQLDETTENFIFVPLEVLERDYRPFTEEEVKASRPSPGAITEYLSALTPFQKTILEQLRSLGWKDEQSHNFFDYLDGAQKRLRIQLRMQGKSAEEIDRLDALCQEGLVDFSHLKRGLGDRREEDYQFQLYLLEEVKRRQQIMLGEGWENTL
ncbi:hypothetical protein VTN96DRAFT_8167 [Rasamsonia emersonii]